MAKNTEPIQTVQLARATVNCVGAIPLYVPPEEFLHELSERDATAR
jgi:hypothetical protein